METLSRKITCDVLCKIVFRQAFYFMSSFFDHSKAERQASKKWGRVENSSKTGTLVQHNGSAPCSSEFSDQMFVFTTLNAGIDKLVWKN